MKEESRSAPCLSCDRDVLPGLDVCLCCGGRPLYASLGDDDYGVETLDIPMEKMRREAAVKLSRLLESVREEDAFAALASGSLRICRGLDRASAEALAAKLGRKETNAQVVSGPPPVPKSGFATPLPYAAGAGTLLLLWLILPLWVAVLGAALAVAAAGMKTKPRPARILGSAPVPPESWVAWAPVAREAAQILREPAHPARERLAAVTGVVHDVLERVRRQDPLGITAGGARGPMAQAATRLLEEATAVARRVQETGDAAQKAAAERALADFAATAAKAREDVLALGRALEAGPTPQIQLQMQQEVESLTRKVDEVRRVLAR